MLYITYDECTFGLSLAFGDNHAIIQQSNIPESKLMKCWNALAFHCVREAVTSGFLQLYHIPRNENPAQYPHEIHHIPRSYSILMPTTILPWRHI